MSISIEPGGPTWTETISLLSQASLLPREPEAEWVSTESECCRFYYITGTDAERDLESLVELAQEQAELVQEKLCADFNEPVEIVFLPRVLGHGGFANHELSISYLDDNYAGSGTDIVLHHELAHKLDGLLRGELRPSLLVEGLAVYLGGGHWTITLVSEDGSPLRSNYVVYALARAQEWPPNVVRESQLPAWLDTRTGDTYLLVRDQGRDLLQELAGARGVAVEEAAGGWRGALLPPPRPR